jgi:hypothetical protein
MKQITPEFDWRLCATAAALVAIAIVALIVSGTLPSCSAGASAKSFYIAGWKQAGCGNPVK